MTSFKRRVVVTRRVEFVVDAPPPWGINWAEVNKMIHVVLQEMRDKVVLQQGETLPDNGITLHPTDEGIIIAYQFEESENG